MQEARRQNRDPMAVLSAPGVCSPLHGACRNLHALWLLGREHSRFERRAYWHSPCEATRS